jgi:hypothetical protein
MAIEEGQNLELDGQSKSRSPEQDISNSSNCLPKISDSDGREGDRRIKEEKNDTDGTDGKGDESRVSTTDPKNYPATEKDKQREDASKESPPKSDQPIDQKDSSVHPNDTK